VLSSKYCKYMKTLKRISLIILFSLVGTYITLTVWMYMSQDSMVFHPQPISDSRISEIKQRYSYVNSFELFAADNSKLSGWVVKPLERESSSVILYFCGNAEEASNMLDIMPRFASWTVVLWNYRGYGQSTGKPSEKDIFSDALQIYDKFAKNAPAVVVFGRSLGTGVAVYVASQRPVAGAILVSPYDSLVELGKQIYPFFPVSLLLRSRFDSYSRAGYIRVPLQVFIGTSDTTVPPERSYRLVGRWLGPKKIEKIVGADHNTVRLGFKFWNSIKDFLQSFEKSQTEE
jgi:alpha-beta hydrolase superfamily lysophospholipase